MTIQKINLRKLLQLFFADARLQRSLLLADIRNEKTKEGREDNGGDFYGPFWADVKDFAAGRSDLTEQTATRIAANKTRARLYPILRDNFLAMWAEMMRWRNEPFEFVPVSVKAQLVLDDLKATVKIENTASVRTWDGSHRVIYPYFSENPALPDQAARLGFWALQEALPDYPIDDFRIVDIQHRRYFRSTDVGMVGDERAQFVQRYAALLRIWEALKRER